jgi:hypothetical protein
MRILHTSPIYLSTSSLSKPAAVRDPADLSEPRNLDLCRAIFEAKRVPLTLIARIADADVREYHRLDWGRVRADVVGEVPAEFDFYFNFVAGEAFKLKALWEE